MPIIERSRDKAIRIGHKYIAHGLAQEVRIYEVRGQDHPRIETITLSNDGRVVSYFEPNRE